jgi:hypothetical protein
LSRKGPPLTKESIKGARWWRVDGQLLRSGFEEALRRDFEKGEPRDRKQGLRNLGGERHQAFSETGRQHDPVDFHTEKTQLRFFLFEKSNKYSRRTSVQGN